ncbi:MAG: addiction module toxin, HicA family [Gammaproteobacteria bacterium]|nr:addiction module toxin, HicA family [Gammaproteobacteria bacterium]
MPTWSDHLVDRTTALCILIHNKEQVLERNSGKLIRMLQQDGWEHVATKGSHWQFRHPAKPGRITIQHPSKDIPRGTVASIYRQAGWSA